MSKNTELLNRAIGEGDVNKVRKAFEQGEQVDNDSVFNMLTKAVYTQNPEMVDLVSRNGGRACNKYPDSHANTLEGAVSVGNSKIIDLVLSAGGDPSLMREDNPNKEWLIQRKKDLPIIQASSISDKATILAQGIRDKKSNIGKAGEKIKISSDITKHIAGFAGERAGKKLNNKEVSRAVKYGHNIVENDPDKPRTTPKKITKKEFVSQIFRHC